MNSSPVLPQPLSASITQALTFRTVLELPPGMAILSPSWFILLALLTTYKRTNIPKCNLSPKSLSCLFQAASLWNSQVTLFSSWEALLSSQNENFYSTLSLAGLKVAVSLSSLEPLEESPLTGVARIKSVKIIWFLEKIFL